MKLSVVFLLLLSNILFYISVTAHGAAECEPDGDIEFICGIMNAEDIIAIPGSDFIIASGRISDSAGSIYAINKNSYESREVFPKNALASNFNTSFSASCPGQASTFQPHGVSYRVGTNGAHTLYVVGHGEREAIEIFELNTETHWPTLRWIGCIIAPDSVFRFNSVTSLPDGAVAATDFNRAGGFVWEWNMGKGWSVVPGSEMAGANGLVSSPSGEWLYIAEYFEKNIVKLSRGQRQPKVERVNVGYMVDNIRWADDDSLFLAGHDRECPEGGGCTNTDVTVILRAQSESLSITPVLTWSGRDFFPVSTVAIEVDDEVWLGGIRGTDRIVRHPK